MYKQGEFMKKRAGLISVLVTIQGLMSFSAYAASNGVFVGNGKAVLGYCDQSNPGALYVVMKGETKIASGKSDQMGCLQAVLPGAEACDEVSLRVKNMKSKEDSRQEYQVPGQYCGQPPGKPSAPTQELADLDKVKKTAENKARQFANAVATNFKQGKSNFIYNFIVGYEAGLDVDTNQNYYKKNFAEGQIAGIRQGIDSGYERGVEAATFSAKEKSKKDVYAQITQSLDASKEVPLAQDTVIPAYNGESNSLGRVSLSQLMSSDDTRKMIAKKFLEAGYDLADFQVNTVMNRSMNLHHILSDLEPAWAYTAHLKNEDASQYVEDLKKMTNAAAAISAYETQFKEVYWSVVDDKIAKKIVQPQPQAQRSGYEVGLSLIAVAAQSQGKADGYASAYKPASQQGFAVTYPTVYSTNFNSHAGRLEKSMEISGVQAAITDAKGGAQFVIGQPVNLAVGSVVNLGKASGAVDVVVSGAMTAKSSLQVKGRSRNKDQVIANIGRISPTATLGTQKVEITIAGLAVSQNLEITWANQLNALTTVQDPQALDELSSFIAGAVLKEWKGVLLDKTVVQNKILYRDPTLYPKSLMGQFENLAVKLKAKNPEVVNQICLKLQKIFFSMLSPASVDNYAQTWLPKTADPEAFKKTYSDARAEVSADPVLSVLANGCIDSNKNAVSCVASINMKSNEDYNKWATGKAKVEAILKK